MEGHVYRPEADAASDEPRHRAAYVPPRLGRGASVRELTKGAALGSNPDGVSGMFMVAGA